MVATLKAIQHGKSRRFPQASGFTLIEVMVVVVILGILAAIIVPQVMSRPQQARMVKVKQDFLAIESALDLYKLDNGTYPTTDQGLQALVSQPTAPPVPSNWKTGGYLQSIPVDPWGHHYQYMNNDEKPKIFTDASEAGGELSNMSVNEAAV
ncbi:MAG TPA: type II secretion system major pseudopilin GspG [Gammaproteobacteria bacterium]|jgi:general secretion pathway protein G|nr:type II secretion system major pseudopilin GspG [Gammaproteobacteria bacterium]